MIASCHGHMTQLSHQAEAGRPPCPILHCACTEQVAASQIRQADIATQHVGLHTAALYHAGRLDLPQCTKLSLNMPSSFLTKPAGAVLRAKANWVADCTAATAQHTASAESFSAATSCLAAHLSSPLSAPAFAAGQPPS